MGILVDQLEDSDKALAITDYQIIRPRIQAQCCQLQLSSAPIALLSLETQSLIEALGHIDIREGPSITIVSPEMNRKVMSTCDELLVMGRLGSSLPRESSLLAQIASKASKGGLVVQVGKATRSGYEIER